MAKHYDSESMAVFKDISAKEGDKINVRYVMENMPIYEELSYGAGKEYDYSEASKQHQERRTKKRLKPLSNQLQDVFSNSDPDRFKKSK